MSSVLQPPTSPVRAYYGDDPRLAGRLEARLKQEINEYAGQLARGLADDWPDYKERVGVIKGLERAVEIAQEIAKQGD